EHDHTARAEKDAVLWGRLVIEREIKPILPEQSARDPSQRESFYCVVWLGTAGTVENQLARRNPQRQLVVSRPLNQARNRIDLGPRVVSLPQAAEPLGSLLQDQRHPAEGFDIVNHGWFSEEPMGRRKWRPLSWPRPAPFQRVQQRGFLAANVG